jgi:hypothetical protein
VALALLAAPAAGADVFSPGELSRAHRALEGLGNCTKCHVAGQQLSQARCLGCHAELEGRVAGGRGFHGRIPAAERDCQTCHHEHQGRDFPLVDWGKNGERAFDHARAGFELRGGHRKVGCARCHDRRLVVDPVVKAMLEKQPRRRSLLGAPRDCVSCHFDEHRGQLGGECQRCHGEEVWRPARGFDHARTSYPLTGRHARVECARCHEAVPEKARAAGPGMTPPVSPKAFARYKGRSFASCTDCHRDPHQERFGARCADCHSTEGWRSVSGAATKRAFHEKTRYPLRGAHARVACQACHGPTTGAAVRYRGIAFERCSGCHADAHVGQLAAAGAEAAGSAARRAVHAAPGPAQECDRCHTVEGFLPVRFDVEDHQRTGYPLAGAHRTVACPLCHPRDPQLASRFPPALKADLARRGRPVLVSLARLDVDPSARPRSERADGYPGAADCRTCHRDPHAGQLDLRVKAEGCTGCHGLDSFRNVKFDHAREARFPLTGKHAQAACGSCHRPDRTGVVRYRPLAGACASCHADPHAAQFAVKGQGTDCARCHGTASWKEGITFVHAEPFTAFRLDGKHRKLECSRCHPAVQVAGTAVRRYRPLPTKCQGCHADFHQGAFRGFAP